MTFSRMTFSITITKVTHGIMTLSILNSRAGNIKGGKYYCTSDLLLDWFGINHMTTEIFFAKQTNPNQSNRRLTVQWYFPLYYSLSRAMLSVVYAVL